MEKILPKGSSSPITTDAQHFLDLYKDAKNVLRNAVEFPRLEEETTVSYAALIDYYLLGVNRSFVNLAKQYETQDAPPTKSVATLRTWSMRYNWTSRISEYEEAVVQKQLAILEMARIEFIGKQVGLLYMMEEAITKASQHIDYEDVNLGQFARAIEKFSDTTQKVFNMTPTIRVASEELRDSQPYRHLTAEESINQLAEFTKMIREREQLKLAVEEEIEENIIDT